MSGSVVSNESLHDFFRPLNFSMLGHDSSKKEVKVRSPRSRTIKFADEKMEAQLMLETILLFEPDASFNDPSVVEAVMEDFHDSCSTFDSWEYAHGGNCPSPKTLLAMSPQIGQWKELEQQVREQQARELMQKGKLLPPLSEDDDTAAVPLEILAAAHQSPISPMPTTSPKKKKISLASPVPPKKMTLLSPGVSPLKSPRSPRQHGKKDATNLRRAMEKSPSLRRLEETNRARREREEEIRQRDELRAQKAAEAALEQQQKQDAERQWRLQGSKGQAVKERLASLEQQQQQHTPARSKSLPSPKRLSLANSPFEQQSQPTSKGEDKKGSTTKRRSSSGPGLRRSSTTEKQQPKSTTSSSQLRRVHTAEPVLSRKSLPAMTLIWPPPEEQDNNDTEPVPVKRHSAPLAETKAMLEQEDKPKDSPSSRRPVSRKSLPAMTLIWPPPTGDDDDDKEPQDEGQPQPIRALGKRRSLPALDKENTKPDRWRTGTTAQQNAHSAQAKRYQEVQAAKEASLVGANAWNQRERSAVQVQAMIRGWMVRRVVAQARAKIVDLEQHLQAMQVSQQEEIESIRNSPELQQLKEEYLAATSYDRKVQIEQEKQVLRQDIQALKDDTQNLIQGMKTLQEHNRKIAKATRETELQCTVVKKRIGTLTKTQEQLSSKWERQQSRVANVQAELESLEQQTETERTVGRICRTTILNVRAHTKQLAATSDDPFLIKVHKRSKILDRISAKQQQQQQRQGGESDSHQQALGACPVVLSR